VAYELALSSGVYSSRQLALIRWIENLALTRSDHIVVRGSYHKQLLQEQGISHVTFIPDGVDVAQIPVLDAADLRKHLGLSDTLVVGMVGTMLWSVRHRMCYGWDIIEALALLPDMPVKALLVGDGDGKPILEQRAQELGVAHRVVFTGKLPYADLPGYLYAMDVCVSTQSNDRIGMVRTTGKLPLYLACNRYVVATDVGEARRVLPGVGGLLPYHGVRDDAHPQRLADHLRYLLAHPERLESALQGREIARTHFDYPLLAQKVQALCQEVRVQTRPSLLAKDFPGRN
jgi:glycosyltransferase involved in cell wall biosynthesis